MRSDRQFAISSAAGSHLSGFAATTTRSRRQPRSFPRSRGALRKPLPRQCRIRCCSTWRSVAFSSCSAGVLVFTITNGNDISRPSPGKQLTASLSGQNSAIGRAADAEKRCQRAAEVTPVAADRPKENRRNSGPIRGGDHLPGALGLPARPARARSSCRRRFMADDWRARSSSASNLRQFANEQATGVIASGTIHLP